MTEPLQDVSTPTLVAAIEANQFKFWPIFASWMQVEIHDDPDLFWTISNIPSPMCNVALRSQITPDKVDAFIDTLTSRCKMRNIPMLWITGPATRPTNLETMLQAHGFIHAGGEPGMAIDLLVMKEDAPILPQLTIKRAQDIETSKTWCWVGCTGFQMPDRVASAMLDFFSKPSSVDDLPIGNYVGYLSGEPVAIASLFLAAGVAGIYNVTTLPHQRGKGIGTAMALALLREARTSGYRIGILQSSEMGVSVYRRLGFQEYCTINQYMWASEQVPARAKSLLY